ncbi:rhamnulokinase [Arthrobacter sp. GAS37]|uniref:rhamnulokinase n=1 Tax=Arthrobacter sp. GAS37 TaxID=3156261 RepID=UPI0038354AFB
MPAFIAVDLGATSGRVCYGIIEDTQIELKEVTRFSNDPLLIAGVLEWDTTRLFQQTLVGLRTAITSLRERGHSASGAGIDSWGVDYGIVRPGAQALPRARHYRSASSETVERLRRRIPARVGYSITGINPLPINTLYQLSDAAERGELTGGEKALLIPDLWVHGLTGTFGAERSIASTTELVDVTTGDWSPQLASRAGIPLSALPQLCDTGTLAGEILPAVRDAISADEPLTVYRVAEHDTASAVLALPAEEPHAFISCGSWSLVGLELDRPVLTEDARSADFTNEQGAYGTTLFMRNLAGLWLLEECVRQWNGNDRSRFTIPDLLQAAQGVPARQFVIDVSDPAFLEPGDLPARIAGYCRQSGQTVPESHAEMTRCIVDSLALAYRAAITTARKISGEPVEVIHMIGGGARNSLLCQLTADACQRPVLAGPAEATSMGNLLVQAISTGAVENVAHARKIVRASTEPLRYNPASNKSSLLAWQTAGQKLHYIQAARKEQS